METCLAGVVVLYNPGSDIVSNIKTYIDNVDKLYLIDNSLRIIGTIFLTMMYTIIK